MQSLMIENIEERNKGESEELPYDIELYYSH